MNCGNCGSYYRTLWKEHKVDVIDVGKRLLRFPSSTDELLGLLEEAKNILRYVCQGVPEHAQRYFYHVMKALISDELLRHTDLDIQVAVASCLNEITRITTPTFPYQDDQMKEIFKLFMIALEELSSESGDNYDRAAKILEYLARTKSCIMMLDIEADEMIVEMFQLLFSTIKSDHSSDIFKYMETIMNILVEESDKISMELLRVLLDSVKMDNKNVSPISWELGKTVFEKCATKLQPRLREAVKAMNLKVNDYAEIVASLCHKTSNGQNMVAEEDHQVRNGNKSDDENPSKTLNSDHQIVHPKDDCAKIVQSEDNRRAHRKRRDIKATSLMRPEEGYEHVGTVGGTSGKRTQPKKKKSKSEKEELINVADKTSTRPHGDYGEEMVNVRIAVWWPLDKTFYTGTVEAYDPLTKKHKIMYDDDEEEILNLREERWKLFNERPRQILPSQKQEGDHLSPPSPANEAVKTQKAKRKAGSSKEQAASSSKRLKGEGHSLVKSDESSPGIVRAKDEPHEDEETCEVIFSSSKMRKNLAGKKASNLEERVQ